MMDKDMQFISIPKNLVEKSFRGQNVRRRLVVTCLSLVALILCGVSLMIGHSNYSIATVIRVLMGDKVQGASFAVSVIRLPRLLIGLLSGFAFGVAGRTFQKMLRNPLASPDIIGITSGTSAAAVFCILVLKLSGPLVSMISVISGLLTAGLIYMLSGGGRFSGGRLILIGIGIQAMLRSLISYLLLSASQYDVPGAMRWLSGSLNTMKMDQVPILFFVILLFTGLILVFERPLQILELGEESAIGLGVKTGFVRLILIMSAVFLLAFATSVTGPIAFVTFLAGPIATRLVGHTSSEVASGLIGAILVIGADFVGQNMLGIKLPAGVITGMIGAPYLIVLLVQMNKRGGLR